MGLLPQTELGERLELRTHDIRFQLRGPRASSAHIVLATITDSTLQPDVWPEPVAFWGAHYARAIDGAFAAGAAWLGMDIVPAVNANLYLETVGARQNAEPDVALEIALQAASGHVVLSYILHSRQGPILPIARFLSPEVNVRLGFVDVAPGVDGVVRQVPYFDHDTEWPYSFPALLAFLARSQSISAPRVMPGVQTFWINPTGRPIDRVPVEQLAAGTLTPQERTKLRGAIILIGMADSGSNDRHRVAGGDRESPGVEILAQSIASLLDGRALHRATPAQEGLLAALLTLGMTLVVAALPFVRGLIVTLATGGLWCMVAQMSFTTGDRLLPIVAPVAGFALAWLGHHTVRSLQESAQRRRVESVFGRYVSPEIRDYLLRAPERLKPGGMEGDATVLFFDIRGSVSFAEHRAPADVIAALNGLFEAIVPVLDANGGLLYRYTGDGFLAVFGAPIPLPDHAQRATETAMEIVRMVHGLNARGGEQPPWRVGCGVHSGPLIYGNLGVAQRLEFTVIGDVVNLAARLEGLNKTFGSEVVLSANTAKSLETPLGLYGPEAMAVAGRDEKIAVYHWRWKSEGKEA
jgi:adenylate cyclase